MMKNIVWMAFKGFVIATVVFNLLLRMASGHAFFVPPEEKLCYLTMIVAFILVSYLPSARGKGRTIVKYITMIALIGVIAAVIYFWKMVFVVDFESLFVGFAFHAWHAIFLLTSVGVLFLVATDHFFKEASEK